MFVAGGAVAGGGTVVGAVPVTGGESGNWMVDGVGTTSQVVGVTPGGKVSGGAVGGTVGRVVPVPGVVVSDRGTVVYGTPQDSSGSRPDDLSPQGAVVAGGVVVVLPPDGGAVGGFTGGQSKISGRLSPALKPKRARQMPGLALSSSTRAGRLSWVALIATSGILPTTKPPLVSW